MAWLVIQMFQCTETQTIRPIFINIPWPTSFNFQWSKSNQKFVELLFSLLSQAEICFFPCMPSSGHYDESFYSMVQNTFICAKGKAFDFFVCTVVQRQFKSYNLSVHIKINYWHLLLGFRPIPTNFQKL